MNSTREVSKSDMNATFDAIEDFALSLFRQKTKDITQSKCDAEQLDLLSEVQNQLQSSLAKIQDYCASVNARVESLEQCIHEQENQLEIAQECCLKLNNSISLQRLANQKGLEMIAILKPFLANCGKDANARIFELSEPFLKFNSLDYINHWVNACSDLSEKGTILLTEWEGREKISGIDTGLITPSDVSYSVSNDSQGTNLVNICSRSKTTEANLPKFSTGDSISLGSINTPLIEWIFPIGFQKWFEETKEILISKVSQSESNSLFYISEAQKVLTTIEGNFRILSNVHSVFNALEPIILHFNKGENGVESASISPSSLDISVVEIISKEKADFILKCAYSSDQLDVLKRLIEPFSEIHNEWIDSCQYQDNDETILSVKFLERRHNFLLRLKELLSSEQCVSLFQKANFLEICYPQNTSYHIDRHLVSHPNAFNRDLEQIDDGMLFSNVDMTWNTIDLWLPEKQHEKIDYLHKIWEKLIKIDQKANRLINERNEIYQSTEEKETLLANLEDETAKESNSLSLLEVKYFECATDEIWTDQTLARHLISQEEDSELAKLLHEAVKDAENINNTLEFQYKEFNCLASTARSKLLEEELPMLHGDLQDSLLTKYHNDIITALQDEHKIYYDDYTSRLKLLTTDWDSVLHNTQYDCQLESDKITQDENFQVSEIIDLSSVDFVSELKISDLEADGMGDIKKKFQELIKDSEEFIKMKGKENSFTSVGEFSFPNDSAVEEDVSYLIGQISQFSDKINIDAKRIFKESEDIITKVFLAHKQKCDELRVKIDALDSDHFII